MNKKLFLIPVAVAVVLVIVLNNIGKCHAEHGNKAEMEVPSTTTKGCEKPKSVCVVLDNSGSMRGYIDFSGNLEGADSATQTMITNVGDFMGNVDSKCKIATEALCGNKKYNTRELLNSMRDKSAFSGAVTELVDLIDRSIALAGDTGVAVVVTDMILSNGKAQLLKQNDKFYNRNDLPRLATIVGNSCKKLEDEDINVLLLKYESDYNGNYYCNFTENIEPNTFKGQLLKKRPYYFFVVGKEEYLKELCVSNCFPKAEKVFSTLELDDDNMVEQAFSATCTDVPSLWQVGSMSPDDQDKKLCLWTNEKPEKGNFTFTFTKIEVPMYAQGAISVEYDTNVLASAVFDENTYSSMTVSLRKFDQLPSFADDVEIEVYTSRYADAAKSSIDTDYGIELSEMEGRTWGFATIMDKIYEAYDINKNSKNKIAELSFALSKK